MHDMLGYADLVMHLASQMMLLDPYIARSGLFPQCFTVPLVITSVANHKLLSGVLSLYFMYIQAKQLWQPSSPIPCYDFMQITDIPPAMMDFPFQDATHSYTYFILHYAQCNNSKNYSHCNITAARSYKDCKNIINY